MIPPSARCSFCGGYGPSCRFECNPVDDFTQVFRFFCSIDHHAKYSTNQPRPIDIYPADHSEERERKKMVDKPPAAS